MGHDERLMHASSDRRTRTPHTNRFALALAVLALLLALAGTALAGPVSAAPGHTATGVQNCARACLSAAPTHARQVVSQSPCTHSGSNAAALRIAVGCCVAAKGGRALVRQADFADTQAAFRHYAKHVKGVELGPHGAARPKTGGADMPEFRSLGEYRCAARQFMGDNPGSGVLERVRPGGDVLRVDPRTGYFGVRSPDGAIRTFFRPDGDPVAYFNKQFNP